VARRSEPSLTDADARLWARVTADVRPLGNSAASLQPKRVRVSVRPQPVEPPSIAADRARVAPDAATLDGGWDRRIRRGELDPAGTIDLHGLTQDEAFGILERAIARAWRHGQRTLLVITGKPRAPDPADTRPRGVIAASFARWLATPALRPYVAAARPAHQRHGGGGAWYIVLRRKR
jgi:DNA-nicking Smr family endonuclease